MKERLEKILEEELGMVITLERPLKEHGDYASNVAFSLAKKEKKSPREIAEKLEKRVRSELFSKVEAKDGFLNFFLSEKALKEELLTVINEREDYKRGGEGGVMVIDYSSPNIAKPFGIGHLRSTIIGQSLYNIYSFLGWSVTGINHLGDWGTQYGKLLYQIKKENKDPEELSVKELEDLYVRFHKDMENDPRLEEKGREWFLKLEKGEEEARRLWQICKRKSLEEFEKIYEELEVSIDHTLGESFYEDKLQDIIEEARKKGVAKESEGALIVEFKDLPPAMLLKSDGSTTYFTRDLAAVKYRLERFSPDKMVYEVGADQVLHLKQLFEAAEKLGLANKENFFHVAHGMFRLKEGKLSTRRGRTVHLEDVLSRIKEKARETVKDSPSLEGLSPDKKERVISKIAVGAVKYNDLKRHYKRSVVFDWDEMLSLKGDSGPYLQYTCVRCKSVLKKGGEYDKAIDEEFNERERELVKMIVAFREIVEAAGNNFSPNIIAEYTHKLAKEFNSFYDEYKISGNDKRMAITEGVLVIIMQCLSLLTISVPEKM